MQTCVPANDSLTSGLMIVAPKTTIESRSSPRFCSYTIMISVICNRSRARPPHEVQQQACAIECGGAIRLG